MKINKYFLNIFFIILSFLISSCATLYNGGRQSIPVLTNPEGAIIFVDGMEYGKTPTKIKLKRSNNHKIEIKKEGFKNITIYTNKYLSDAFWFNCIIGGLLGMLIDVLDGSAYDIDVKSINLNLEKDSSTGSIQKKLNNNINQINILNENGVQLAGIQIQWK